MVAIFAEKVMAEQAEIVQKRAGMWGRTGSLGIGLGFCATYEMVVGEGFEPSKSVTADLQSAPFGRSGIPPGIVMWLKMIQIQMVVGEGFEPSKSVTADLQSAPFGRSGIPPWPESFSLKAGRIIPNAIRV